MCVSATTNARKAHINLDRISHQDFLWSTLPGKSLRRLSHAGNSFSKPSCRLPVMAVSTNLNLTTVSLQAKDSISRRELLQSCPELCCQTSLHVVIGWEICHAVGAHSNFRRICCLHAALLPRPRHLGKPAPTPWDLNAGQASSVHHPLDYDQVIRAPRFTTASAALSGVTQATKIRKHTTPVFVSQRQSASHDLSIQA